ncbi:MAG: 1-acyl-sn-glycerol-3-phosphate acyltransferase [Clostridia bacterium]|nr:1-acyl-sn-glycerol-3-phosphate acyltransferase [Clostridia bacterium]
MKPNKYYKKPGQISYRLARIASFVLRKRWFHTKVVRNEVRKAKGAFVLIANHQCALDFVNLIGLTSRRMTFVLSDAFYQTLPIPHVLNAMHPIHKQQFATTPSDLRKMKEVIHQNQGLVIFPAGLMSEDGLSTPIPQSTYDFLKWLGADVYVARSEGGYFVMPKWSKKVRPGKTYMDAFQLFSKEELAEATAEEVKRRTDEALLFDAYRDQAAHPVLYHGGEDIDGLENVLYRCPGCGTEFSISCREKRKLVCSSCGFTANSDAYGILHDNKGRTLYPSDWSREIFRFVKEKLRLHPEEALCTPATVCLVDKKHHKFAEAGKVQLTLDRMAFTLDGILHGTPFHQSVSLASLPMLPFSPGRYIEIQSGSTTYRCFPEDGRMAQKFINYVKAFFEMRFPEKATSADPVPASTVASIAAVNQ